MIEVFRVILYTLVVGICCINFTTWKQENKRVQESNLRQEANRDRSNDWERHRGGS